MAKLDQSRATQPPNESEESLPQINVEKEMRTVVRAEGGVVLTDVLSHPPEFENADFVFHEEKVIIELKCLTEDTIWSPNNQAKTQNLWRRCYVKKLVSEPNENDRDWRCLPKAIQNQFYEINTRTIKKRLQKANRQVRETKACLELTDYTGIAIMVNDGIRSLSPPAFIHATQLALRKDFREIRHFVFVTANLFTQMRGVQQPVLFWINFSTGNEPPIGGKLLDRLGASWRHHYETITGIPCVEQEFEDIEAFWYSQVMRA